MKTMTCKQLGEACDKEFHAETFDEIAEMSKKHGMEMYEKNDKEHINAMNKIGKLMNDPKAIKKWIDDKKKEFDNLPNK